MFLGLGQAMRNADPCYTWLSRDVAPGFVRRSLIRDGRRFHLEGVIVSRALCIVMHIVWDGADWMRSGNDVWVLGRRRRRRPAPRHHCPAVPAWCDRVDMCAGHSFTGEGRMDRLREVTGGCSAINTDLAEPLGPPAASLALHCLRVTHCSPGPRGY